MATACVLKPADTSERETPAEQFYLGLIGYRSTAATFGGG